MGEWIAAFKDASSHSPLSSAAEVNPGAHCDAPLSLTSVSLPNGRVTVRANQDKCNHTGLRSLIHPIVDCAPLDKHITCLEMHDSIVHLHVDCTRHHHRV